VRASNDVRRLVADGLLERDGAGRSARYLASERLQDAWLETQLGSGRRPGRPAAAPTTVRDGSSR
jgi:hypothetical protein